MILSRKSLATDASCFLLMLSVSAQGFVPTGTGTYRGSDCSCFLLVFCSCSREDKPYYYYYDTSVCTAESKCPLYAYVDGTENAENILDRDYVFLEEMAARGFVAVAVDYGDSTFSYPDSTGYTFQAKSKYIFDETLGSNSVVDQLCNENTSGPDLPVDCSMGIAVNGWSQGAHLAALAKNSNSQVTAALLFGNGNSNNLGGAVPVNSNQLLLPKERRRSIVGESDNFFGGNFDNVQQQQIATSGYDCSAPNVQRFDCFNKLPEGCAYADGENYCPETGQYYKLSCEACDEVSSCPSDAGLRDSACPNEDKAGYYIVPGAEHNFMNVADGSEFMDLETPWGLPQNFDWLAQMATTTTTTPVPTTTTTTPAPTTTTMTPAPTTTTTTPAPTTTTTTPAPTTTTTTPAPTTTTTTPAPTTTTTTPVPTTTTTTPAPTTTTTTPAPTTTTTTPAPTTTTTTPVPTTITTTPAPTTTPVPTTTTTTPVPTTTTTTPVPTASSTTAITVDLIISEIFPDPHFGRSDADAEFIEIFNPGASDVTLTGANYVIRDLNRQTTLVGEIKAGEHFVVCRNNAYSEYNGLCDQDTNIVLRNTNGGEIVTLLKNGVGIDEISYTYANSERRDQCLARTAGSVAPFSGAWVWGACTIGAAP